MTDAISSNTAPGASDDRPIVLLNKVDVVLLGHAVLHNLTWELLPGEHWAGIRWLSPHLVRQAPGGDGHRWV